MVAFYSAPNSSGTGASAQSCGTRSFPNPLLLDRICTKVVECPTRGTGRLPCCALLCKLQMMTNDEIATGRCTVTVTRGAGVDAWHRVSIAVVDSAGSLLWHAGDPRLVTMTRSALKPFQALPLLTSGAADAFGLVDQELAIAQASHNGTDEHVRWVSSLLGKARANASDLQCGAHLPIGMQTEKRWPLKGEDTDPLRHNCSGKHAGFLTVARHLGLDPKRYLEGDAAVQLAVKTAVATVTGLDADALPIGIDGCSAPNYALPLWRLAGAFARLAAADQRSALGRLREAQRAHPLLISGTGQFDFDLAQASAGEILCKSGAEGIVALALLQPGIGIVLKVHDGNPRALPPTALAVLRQLNVLSAAALAQLEHYAKPRISNAAGRITGELCVELDLSSSPISLS